MESILVMGNNILILLVSVSHELRGPINITEGLYCTMVSFYFTKLEAKPGSDQFRHIDIHYLCWHIMVHD